MCGQIINATDSVSTNMTSTIPTNMTNAINNIQMENTELEKNWMRNCACYYFGDVTEIEDFDFGDILFDEKSYENILIDDISYKILIGAKLLHIMFDKVYGFIRNYDGIFSIIWPSKI